MAKLTLSCRRLRDVTTPLDMSESLGGLLALWEIDLVRNRSSPQDARHNVASARQASSLPLKTRPVL
jgi:hypothetical protein